MLIRFTAFLFVLFFLSCKSRTINALSVVTIPRDSCYFQEMIVGSDGDKTDTLCFLRLNLESGTKQVFMNDQLNLGMEAIVHAQSRGFSFNIVYTEIPEKDRLKQFVETTNDNRTHIGNFRTNKPGARMDASCLIVFDKGLPLEATQSLFGNERFERVKEMVKKQVSYSQVSMSSVLIDHKKVLFLQK